jgi:hypothetical protein
MAFTKVRTNFASLWLIYTAAGSLLAALAVTAESTYETLLEARSFQIPNDPSLRSVDVDFGLLLLVWGVSLIPAGVAAWSLCVAMLKWPQIREVRYMRVAFAAALGALSSLAFLVAFMSWIQYPALINMQTLTLLWPFGVLGALCAAVLAYFVPNASNAI